jgi:Putative peptidoglycan binding domain
VHETRRTSSARATRAAPTKNPLDDWLGEVSDDDWSEQATERAARRRATPAYEALPVPSGELVPASGSARPPPARPVAAVEARRAVIERRRLVAGVVLAVLLGVGIATPVVLLTGGEQPTVASPTTTTTARTDISPETTPVTTPTTPTQPTDTTTTPADGASFTLPEGVKLQREGENDPALVSELQEALAEAGFAPGSADGTFGQQTEAAVVAFQQANDLSVDGRVGPETTEALNQALASG